MAKAIPDPLPKEIDTFGREFIWETIPSGGFRVWLADRSACVGLTSKDKAAALEALAAIIPVNMRQPEKHPPQITCPRCGLDFQGHD